MRVPRTARPLADAAGLVVEPKPMASVLNMAAEVEVEGEATQITLDTLVGLVYLVLAAEVLVATTLVKL